MSGEIRRTTSVVVVVVVMMMMMMMVLGLSFERPLRSVHTQTGRERERERDEGTNLSAILFALDIHGGRWCVCALGVGTGLCSNVVEMLSNVRPSLSLSLFVCLPVCCMCVCVYCRKRQTGGQTKRERER